MLVGIIGESCVGKSTLAEKLQDRIGGKLISGKDYLRLAKSEGEATALFREMLAQAVTGEHLIYVASEKEQAELLPKGAVKVLLSADIQTIKDRFRARMHGHLPAPVEQMLERKHGMFEGGDYALRFDSERDTPEGMCAAIDTLLSGSYY